MTDPRESLPSDPFPPGFRAMPKMKTNRSIAKRFRVTKKGKVMRYRAGGSHLNSHKRASRKRKLRKSGSVQGRQAVTYRRLLGGI